MKFSLFPNVFSTTTTVATTTMMLCSSLLLFTTTPATNAESPPMLLCGGNEPNGGHEQLNGIINSDILVKPNTSCSIQNNGTTINGSIYLQDGSKLFVLNGGIVKHNIIANESVSGTYNNAAIIVKGTNTIVEGDIVINKSNMWTFEIGEGSTIGGNILVEDSTINWGFRSAPKQFPTTTGNGGATVMGDVTLRNVITTDTTLSKIELKESTFLSNLIIEGCQIAGDLIIQKMNKIYGNINIALTSVDGTNSGFLIEDNTIENGDINIDAVIVNNGNMYVNQNQLLNGDLRIIDTTANGSSMFAILNKINNGYIIVENSHVFSKNNKPGELRLVSNTISEHIIVENNTGLFCNIMGNTIGPAGVPVPPEAGHDLEVIDNTFTSRLTIGQNTIANDFTVTGNTVSSGSLPSLTANIVGGETEIDFANN